MHILCCELRNTLTLTTLVLHMYYGMAMLGEALKENHTVMHLALYYSKYGSQLHDVHLDKELIDSIDSFLHTELIQCHRSMYVKHLCHM